LTPTPRLTTARRLATARRSVASPPEFAGDFSERVLLLPRSFYATEDYARSHPECLQEVQPRVVLKHLWRALRHIAKCLKMLAAAMPAAA
jgi:hypothetical protein